MMDFSSPRRANQLGWLLLLPALALVGTVIAYPLLLSLDFSFQEVKFARIGQRKPWTFANYERLLGSEEFWKTSWVTAKLIVTVTGASFIIGFATALLVNQRFKGRALARLLVALPWAVPEVVAVVVWWWIFDSSFGLLNWILVRADLADQPVKWFSDPDAAFFAVSAVMVWKGYPFVSIMLLAGLQSIPEELHQAAKVDGAGAIRRFLHITLPVMAPVLVVTLIFVILWVFRDFSIIYVLTGGGPLGETQTLSIMTYEQAFSFFKMGYAAAVGIVTLVVCVIVSRLLAARATGAMF